MHSYDLLCTAKSFWLKCALIFEVRSRRGPLCLCSGTKSVANARHINNWTHSTRMNMIRTAAHSWCSNYLGALKVLFFEPKVLYRAKIEGGMPVCLFNLRHGIKDSVFFCVISIHHLMMSHSMSRFAQLQWSFEFWIGTRPRFTSSSWWLWASDRTGWSCARGHWCDAAVLTRVFLMFDRDCLLLTASFYKSVLITWHVIHRLQVNLRNLAILLSWWNSSCSTFRSFIC